MSDGIFEIRYKNWGIEIILMNEKYDLCNNEFNLLRNNRMINLALSDKL